MTISEFYTLIDENEKDVRDRLQLDRLILKFILKFKDDQSYQQLKASLVKDNCEGAFRASHTLKGICANLGFGKLDRICTQITELLREEKLDLAKQLEPQLDEEYQRIIQAIQGF